MFTLEVMLAIDTSLNSSRGLHFSSFKSTFLPPSAFLYGSWLDIALGFLNYSNYTNLNSGQH